MVKKKRAAKPEYKPTRRQLSHWQRQQRRRRLILGLGMAVIAAVVVLVGLGLYFQWYLPEYKPLHQTVIEVNGTRFNMDYFIKALEFNAGGQSMYVPYLVDPTAEAIQQNELIRQQAQELGFTISNREVDQELENGDLPINQATRDMVRAQLLIDQLREDYFGPQLPQSTEQRHILVMFLESQSQAAEVRDRLEADEDFGGLAGELSLLPGAEEDNGDLDWRPQGIWDGLLATTVVDDYVFSAEVGTVSPPIYDEAKTKGLGYWLIEVLEKKDAPEEVHVRAMLLASEEEALEVKARIEAGEDFGQLAAELSQLYGAEEDNGDLGWVVRGSHSQAFEMYVFDPETEPGSLSPPILDDSATTQGGYWLIKVLDADDNRPISDEDREILLTKALDDWLASLWDDPENEVINYLDDEMRAFAIAKAS